MKRITWIAVCSVVGIVAMDAAPATAQVVHDAE